MNVRATSAAASGAHYVCASCRAQLAGNVASRGNPGVIRRRNLHHSTKARLEEAAARWKAKASDEAAGKRPTMLSILEERGYVNQIAGERAKTEEIMRRERIGAYVGIDPTAPSMHVGHLVPFMALFWMYAHEYHAYTILGGATAQVGDPTGRTTTRQIDGPSRKENIVRMHLQMKTIWQNVHDHLTKRMGYKLEYGSKRGLLNNNTWLHKLSITEFLRLLGNRTRVGTMLGRETARHKMEHGDGLSFSEFTYPLLQGWDWWQLYKMLNVKLQIGGSDQMGNIVAGKEAFMNIAQEDQFESGTADLSGATPIGFTVPLLTTASGAKFGKSAGNAIWLDPEMTSVFDQYQFFLRTHDADLERYLKLFTFLPMERIAEIMEQNGGDPKQRVAGKALAEQVCLALHGQHQTERAQEESAALFGGRAAAVQVPGRAGGAEPQTTGPGFKDRFINTSLNPRAPQTNSATPFERGITLPVSRVQSATYPALLKYTGLVSSRSEGNRLIRTGGAYVGATAARQTMRDELSFAKILQGQHPSTIADYSLDDSSILVLRVGKWKTKVIRMVSDAEWSEGVKKGRAEMGGKVERPSAGTAETEGSEAGPAPRQEESKYVAWARLDEAVKAEDARFEEEAQAKRGQVAEYRRLMKATKTELAAGAK